MSKWSSISSALVLVAACGAPAPELDLALRMDAALHDRVTALSLYVFGPKRSDDILVTCQSLMTDDVLAADPRLEVLASTRVTDFQDGSVIAVDGVASGPGRIVFVEVFDATETRIGAGCKESVEVPEGDSVDVEVTVYQLR